MAVPAAVFAAALVLWAANPPLLQDVQWKAFDAFQRLAPRRYRPVPVRIVDIDDRTLALVGQWPWPRSQIADLLARVRRAGASVVAFDVVFAEPDRTSPKQVLESWSSTSIPEAVQAAVQALPDHDQVFAQAIAQGRVVTGFSFTAQPGGEIPALKAGFAYSGEAPDPYLTALPGTVRNLTLFEEAAAGNGHFNLLVDRDGMVRRVPLLVRYGEAIYPSLVAETLRVHQGASTYAVKTSSGSGQTGFGARTGIVSVKIGALPVPTDAAGNVWLYQTGPVPERVIPAWRILRGEVPAGALSNYLVFIGTSATGLKDLRATPLNPVAAGVEVHAQLAEQLLLQEFLERPDWARGAEAVYLLLLGIALLLLLPRLGAVGCAGVALAAMAGALGLSWVAFRRWHLLVDPVAPSLLALAIYAVGSFLSFLRTEAERRQVRLAFSRYLSPALVDRLARYPEQLRLGGEMKPMTILFADIRGFTAIAEQYDAQGLTQFMNQFLTPMTAIVLERRGTIDKYIGDCIMAFWNAPLDDPEHARHACEAAVAMRQHLVQWNKARYAAHRAQSVPFQPVQVGIGLNTGTCCVGNLGSEQRFDYSVLGDAVNLASRLEGQSKAYGVDIVLGESTAALVRDYALLELDLVTVAGKTTPTRIFGLLGDAALAREERFRALQAAHQELLAAYRAQDWERAQQLGERCAGLDTEQLRLRTLYALYRQRISAYRAHPPGAGWNGVVASTSK